MPLAYTLDHVGPITRTVRDAALMLQVIAGHDRNDSTSSRERVPDYSQQLESGISGMKIGRIRELCDGLSPEVQNSFEAAVEQLGALGATVEEVSIPSLPLAGIINGVITWAEATEIHQELLATRANDYGDDVRGLLEAGMLSTASSYIRAQRARARVLADANQVLSSHDLLIAPGAAIPAPKISESLLLGEGDGVDTISTLLRFTQSFDTTGQPAIALPTGLSSEGLPLALQIVGRPFDEVTVLRAASAYEKARGALPDPPPLR